MGRAHVGYDRCVLASGDQTKHSRGNVAAGYLGIDDVRLPAVIGGMGTVAVHGRAVGRLVGLGDRRPRAAEVLLDPARGRVHCGGRPPEVCVPIT